MGLAWRNGRAYYSRSIRRDGKVTSEYVGSGEFAEIIATLDRGLRADRRLWRLEIEAARRGRIEADRAERSRLRGLRGRLDGAERLVFGYSRRVDAVVGETLAALGFHRHHRGDWRKQRGSTAMKSGLARLNVRELVRLAREGDRLALGELSWRGTDTLHRVATDGEGYLDDHVERALIEQLGPGHGALHKEAVAARMALMRDDLAPAGSSPVETLLAERASICWLHVQLLEYEAVSFAECETFDRDIQRAREHDRRAEVFDRRLARAQSRYIQALTALAKVRRLAIPIVITQLNLAGNQLVNVGRAEDGSREP